MELGAKNELISNLDRLHTTAMGVMRIKKNLCLDSNDVVAWCKRRIEDPHSGVVRKGKNWYAVADDCEITVNAHSCTIITAHKLKK